MKFFASSLLIFLFVAVNTQEKKRVILDKDTHKPIPYATIKVLNKPIGTIADEKGNFDIISDNTDSILITSVGYNNEIIEGAKMTDTIFLESKIQDLEKITVRAKKLLRTLTLGYDTTNFDNTKNWGPAANAELAQIIELPNSNSSYKLTKIFLRIKPRGCVGPLLLHIYATDTVFSKPGEELFSKPVYFNKGSVKKNKATIDMSSDNIYWRGEKSFFIGFSWLPDAAKEQCLTTIFFLQTGNKSTFKRSITSTDYNWFQFNWGKDSLGKPIPASPFFSAEVDELK